MLQLLDAAALRRWAEVCVQELTTHCSELNALNVFPVADADTGTNLVHTVRAGRQAMDQVPEEASSSYPALASALARGSVRGARGNSGVIVSQLLRALAEVPEAEAGLNGQLLARALRRADELAYTAVSAPVEGTVLTVLRAASDAAHHAETNTLAAVADEAARAAADALAATTGQLAALARAGVVDAGGRGLVVMLDALLAVITGAHVASREFTGTPRPAAVLSAARESGSAAQDYEVMYLLDQTTDEEVRTLRAVLHGLGDSVVIVDDGHGVRSVHVHCNDVGAAVEAGIVAGRPHRITVMRFTEQADGSREPATDRTLLALVAGAEVAALFAAEGAAVLRCDDIVVDEAAVRAAIIGTRAGHVTVLPNGLLAGAALAGVVAEIRRAGQGVTLLPTSSPVQGLAALAVHDPRRDTEDDALAMAEAAAATRRGAVRVAREQALTWVGRCEPGDVLGLLDDDVVLMARGDDDERQSDVVRGLLDRMLDAGGELVTVLTGAAMEVGLDKRMQEHVRAVHPGVELVVYPGGVPGEVVLLGVE